MKLVIGIALVGLMFLGCSSRPGPDHSRHTNTMDKLTHELDNETRD